MSLYISAAESPGMILLGGKIVGSFTIDSEKKVHLNLHEDNRWGSIEELVAHASSVAMTVSFELKFNDGLVTEEEYDAARVPRDCRK